MECFKRIKFWKRAGNRKTGVIRGILKRLVPCIRQGTSPSPERRIKENTTQGGIGARYEALLEEERGQELMDIQDMIHGEESPHIVQVHGSSIEETEEDHRRGERDLCQKGFTIMKYLGQGAYGQVVLARKKSTGRQSLSEELFALKFVPHSQVTKTEKEVLFRAVGHPFLIQLHGCFKTGGSLCYVLEYMEGGSLHSLLSRLERFPEDVARFYAAEIILGLNFLHKCGIVHGDVSLYNILLDRDGHCKLADFGVSQVGTFTRSRTAGNCGTDRYMAPEIQHGQMHEQKEDWWSLGCVMCEMMLGTYYSLEALTYLDQNLTTLTQDAVSIVHMVRLDNRCSFVENWLETSSVGEKDMQLILGVSGGIINMKFN